MQDWRSRSGIKRASLAGPTIKTWNFATTKILMRFACKRFYKRHANENNWNFLRHHTVIAICRNVALYDK